MGIGEISKGQVEFPRDSSTAGVSRGEDVAGVSSPIVEKKEQDTIGRAASTKVTDSPIPGSPDKPVVPEADAELVMVQGQEEAVKQNKWFSGSPMSDFYVLTHVISKLLGKSRFMEETNRINTRTSQYEYSIATAEIKKESKLNEASQELLRGVSSFVEAGIEGFTLGLNLSSSTVAQNQYNKELNDQKTALTNHQDSVNVLQKGQEKPQVEIWAEKYGQNITKVAPGEPNYDQNDLISYQPENVGDAAQLKEIKDNNEIIKKRIMEDPPAAMKNDKDYKQYKKELDNLESTVQSTTANYTNIFQQKLSTIEANNRMASQAVQNAFKGLWSFLIAEKQIDLSELQYEEGELNAQIELLRSFIEGYSKSSQQASDTFNELLRGLTQIQEKIAHASFKSA